MAVPEGFSIRAPTHDDIDQLIGVDIALPQHQQLAPVFSDVAPWSIEESRAEWEQTLADDKEHVLIGLQGRPPGRDPLHDGLLQLAATTTG